MTMRPALALVAALSLSTVPAVQANESFDLIASTVEVLAGAEYCGRSSQDARLDVGAWIDREIASASIKAIWQDAIQDRLEAIASYAGYDCKNVVAKYDTFDFSPFRKPVPTSQAEVAATPAAPNTSVVPPVSTADMLTFDGTR